MIENTGVFWWPDFVVNFEWPRPKWKRMFTLCANLSRTHRRCYYSDIGEHIPLKKMLYPAGIIIFISCWKELCNVNSIRYMLRCWICRCEPRLVIFQEFYKVQMLGTWSNFSIFHILCSVKILVNHQKNFTTMRISSTMITPAKLHRHVCDNRHERAKTHSFLRRPSASILAETPLNHKNCEECDYKQLTCTFTGTRARTAVRHLQTS